MFIEINSITKKYDEIFALKNFNLSLEKGEIISIIGPSGSGKSTILKCISGICRIDSGKIIINNKRVDHQPINKRNISYVFQESPLFPHLNITKNILFNLKNYDKEKLYFLLNKTKLEHIQNKYPFQISGGENQRAAVVRSLIRNPDLFLLDEPFNNLDNSNKNQLKEVIVDIIKETNTTTIFVNHETQDSLDISDKILILVDGKTETIDSPINIYKKPKNLKIAKMFGEINELIVDDKKVYCRIQNLTVVTKSSIKAKVIESKFIGQFYKIKALVNTKLITLLHVKNIKKDEIIYLKINKENQLHF
tara:strand:+ start:5412 stop:6332 length:921 start_codon:yes stop_codon:yes gene_type:complete